MLMYYKTLLTYGMKVLFMFINYFPLCSNCTEIKMQTPMVNDMTCKSSLSYIINLISLQLIIL